MSNINQQYKFTAQIFEQIYDQINIDIKMSSYPFTYKALLRNTAKIDYILKGISDTKNIFYVSQILTRTLLEHYLVGHYIWTKLRIDEKDDVGEEYYKNYFCSEYFKQDNYNFNIENIKENKKDKLDFERIRLQYPEFNEMTQSDLNNIHTVSNQFDIRKIGNYLNNRIPNNDEFKTLHISMLDFLKRYSHLSSYIHGGPSSEMHSFDNEENINKEKICSENVVWGEIASEQTKQNIILALAIEFPSKYLPVFKTIIDYNQFLTE